MRATPRRFRALPLAAGITAALAIAACGGAATSGGRSAARSGASAPAADPRSALLDSVERTTAASYQADLTVNETLTGMAGMGPINVTLPMHIRAESSQREEATIDTTVVGQRLDLVVIVYDGTAYVSSDGGTTFKSVSGLASIDQYTPQSALQYLQAVGSVTDEGPGTVDGVAVERYHAVLDTAKLISVVQSQLRSLSGLGSGAQTIQSLLGSLNFTSATADASVDHAGRLVSENADLALSLDLSSLGTSASGTMTVQEQALAHFYDYGAAITIQPPG